MNCLALIIASAVPNEAQQQHIALQVVTKRTKNLKKQDIPSLDDPIAKLNHVGKETVKKLNELKNSADEIQMDLHLPNSLSRWHHVMTCLEHTDAKHP